MKVHELFEESQVARAQAPRIEKIRKMSKDAFLKELLLAVKDGINDWQGFKKAKNLLYLARKAGLDYPEFEGVEKSIGKGERAPFRGYTLPKYNSERGYMMGSNADWLEDHNISLQDVAQALSIVKNSELFKSLKKVGLTYEHNAAGEKNGTLRFSIPELIPVGHGKYRDTFTIYVNGLIRRSIRSNAQYKMRTLKPVVGNDKVESLVHIYNVSLQTLIAYIESNKKK